MLDNFFLCLFLLLCILRFILWLFHYHEVGDYNFDWNLFYFSYFSACICRCVSILNVNKTFFNPRTFMETNWIFPVSSFSLAQNLCIIFKIWLMQFIVRYSIDCFKFGLFGIVMNVVVRHSFGIIPVL